MWITRTAFAVVLLYLLVMPSWYALGFAIVSALCCSSVEDEHRWHKEQRRKKGVKK